MFALFHIHELTDMCECFVSLWLTTEWEHASLPSVICSHFQDPDSWSTDDRVLNVMLKLRYSWALHWLMFMGLYNWVYIHINLDKSEDASFSLPFGLPSTLRQIELLENTLPRGYIWKNENKKMDIFKNRNVLCSLTFWSIGHENVMHLLASVNKNKTIRTCTHTRTRAHTHRHTHSMTNLNIFFYIGFQGHGVMSKLLTAFKIKSRFRFIFQRTPCAFHCIETVLGCVNIPTPT